jgi:hypothetical protein
LKNQKILAKRKLNKKKNKILLVEPDFPIPPKSKNHKNFLPIGLLKIASYLRANGTKVRLVRGIINNQFVNRENKYFKPAEIWITSLFTFWSENVRNAVIYYKNVFPKAKVVVGGIYASLMPKHCKKYTGCDEVYVGVMKEAEKFPPAYDLIDKINSNYLDYQIVHASRGCKRSCAFCGTWKIEPNYLAKKSIIEEIKLRKVIFYDNNFLANPYIENILSELTELKKEKKILWCESQSGFDGRILLKKPYLAKMIREAGFRYPRIAWDWNFSDHPNIKKQINVLKQAGYRSRDIFIFMLYNWDIPLNKMELKRKKCWQWKVQIADCRYRPINQTFDYYYPKREQTRFDYFIHKKWTDEKVKKFRRNVRSQNICVRQEVSFYSRKLENRLLSKEQAKRLKRFGKREVRNYLDDVWFPDED